MEDNEVNRGIACELLSQTGLTIKTATNGEKALESFRNNAEGYYELILMDIHMPVMNGYDGRERFEICRVITVKIFQSLR